MTFRKILTRRHPNVEPPGSACKTFTAFTLHRFLCVFRVVRIIIKKQTGNNMTWACCLGFGRRYMYQEYTCKGYVFWKRSVQTSCKYFYDTLKFLNKVASIFRTEVQRFFFFLQPEPKGGILHLLLKCSAFESYAWHSMPPCS